MIEELKNHPMNLPRAKYLVKIHVEEIFDLRPGSKEKC